MKTQIKIPAVGESITEATIAQWNKKNGDIVKRDEILLTLETDKASVEVVAETAGKLSIAVQEGQTVAIGSVVGEIDAAAAGADAGPAPKPTAPPQASASTGTPAPKPQAPPVPPKGASAAAAFTNSQTSSTGSQPLSPAVKKLVAETGINPASVQGTGKDGRLTKGDVMGAMNRGGANSSAAPAPAAASAPAAKSAPTPLPQPRVAGGGNETTREPMTKIRQTIAKRLVEAQHNAAILTTFNEIDMTNVMALRAKYKDSFEKKHGIKLGFMGFFVKAAIEALKAYPKVNAYIEGTDLIYHHYYNIGMAVGTDKGLLVPIIKNAESLSLAEVEMSIKHYADKARDGKINLDDLNNGTFTISNGGVYGSLMSTPILNPPQSGILGLHKIEERPVAINGKVEIRPMMYVALSYDHRVIDGAQSVGFLVKIKDCMEDPARILLEI